MRVFPIADSNESDAFNICAVQNLVVRARQNAHDFESLLGN